MVTALFVAAQHPLGLDLQIRNLRWAIDGPKRLVVFTFKGLFQPSLYPNIEFVEVDADPGKYYSFHNYDTIGAWLYKNADDVIVMSELDTFFTEKINHRIEQVRATGEIHVGSMDWWYSLAKDGKKIMTRIWEGGLIIRAKPLLLAHHMGICQAQPMTDPIMIGKMNNFNLGFTIGNGVYKYGELHPKFGHTLGDNYTPINIMAYFMDYKVKTYTLSHVKGPETVHRENPEWYNDIDNHYLEVIKKHAEKAPGTVFHLFLLGKASKRTLISCGRMIKHHYWRDIIDLLDRGHEWMTPETYHKLKEAARTISEC